MSLTFTVGEGGRVQIVKGTNHKEFSKEAFVGILQMVLATISPNRDYSSIVSINKLLKVIDLECEPDESDGEQDEDAPSQQQSQPAAATTSTVAAPATPAAEPAAPPKRPPPRAAARSRVAAAAKTTAQDDDD